MAEPRTIEMINEYSYETGQGTPAPRFEYKGVKGTLIRCGDCRNLNPEKHTCGIWKGKHLAEDYCSRGERRGTDGE